MWLGGNTGRHLALATLVREWGGETPESLNAAFEGGDKFAPEPVSEQEAALLTRDNPLADAPLACAGGYSRMVPKLI